MFIGVDRRPHCVRTVSDTPRNPRSTPSFTGTHRRLSMLRKLLIGECVGRSWCASALAHGVDFQACSIDHSDISPFGINHLRTVWNSVAQNPPSHSTALRSDLHSAVCGRFEIDSRENCVRPSNVVGSLKGISLSWRSRRCHLESSSRPEREHIRTQPGIAGG
jgi:hypothetical protein